MNNLYNLINLDKLKAQIDKEENMNQAVAYDLLEELVFMKEAMEELKKTVQLHGATYIFKQGEQEYLKENPDAFDPKKYGTVGMQHVTELVKQKISVCGSEGQA